MNSFNKSKKKQNRSIFGAFDLGQGDGVSTPPSPPSDGDSSKILDFFRAIFSKRIKVDFPDYLYTPEDALSFDARNLFDVDPGVTVDVIRFTCPTGAITRIIDYGVFNDGLLASQFDFIPTVDGLRVYQYQGDPLENFRIYLGVSDDLGNQAMIGGLLNLLPGQTLLWRAQNRSAVTTTMGVRVRGFVSQRLFNQARSGG